MSDSNSPFKLDRSPSITQRNRYANIQPWENSRIQLKSPIGGSDYVNASPIKLQSLSRHAARKIRRTSSTHSASSISLGDDYNYIATQGPKEGQFAHFWHMVMQESIGSTGVIIMLTPTHENNKEKCAQYFPRDKQHPIILAPERRTSEHSSKGPVLSDDGDPFLDSPYQTTGSNLFPSEHRPSIKRTSPPPPENGSSVSMTEAGKVEVITAVYDKDIGCVVRTLKLTIGSQEKTVIHYLYEHWPDFGKPEAEERAALLRLMKKSKKDAGESPRVVHCSAGVGRTGTFVALDFLTSELGTGQLARRVDDDAEGDSDVLSEADQTATAAQYDTAQPASAPPDTTTYGKSGIARSKIKTPELRQGSEYAVNSNIQNDLIHDTVDSLRQQRMMMVMNDVQYSLLYEILKDAFLDMYAEKATGATIVGQGLESGDGGDVQDGVRSQKAVRKGYEQRADGGDDMVLGCSSPATSEGVGSEADTEIEGTTPRVDVDHEEGIEENDPYAEVAPEHIRRDLGMQYE